MENKRCSSPDCRDPQRDVVARGLCRRCYARAYARERTKQTRECVLSAFSPAPKIKASRCIHKDSPHYANGFCRTCYVRERRRAIKKGTWEPKFISFNNERMTPAEYKARYMRFLEEEARAAVALKKPDTRRSLIDAADFGAQSEDME